MLTDIKSIRSAYFFSFRRFLLYFALIHQRFSWTKQTWSDWEFFIWNWEKTYFLVLGMGPNFGPKFQGFGVP